MPKDSKQIIQSPQDFNKKGRTVQSAPSPSIPQIPQGKREDKLGRIVVAPPPKPKK